MKAIFYANTLLICILVAFAGCKSTVEKTSADSVTTAVLNPAGKLISPVKQFGQLSVTGNMITDSANNPVQLRGMSFFWSQWMGQFYNPETVLWLKQDWRCTVVRAAMGVEMDGYLENPEEEKRKVMAVVDAAIQHGLYVIIDWHDHHGEQHEKDAKIFFAEMAQRYGKYPNVIYELYNEPLNVSWSVVLKPYYKSVMDTIRHYDPDNIIVCGTPNWSQDVEKAAADPLEGKNIAYTLHFYATTHRQGLRNKAQEALQKGIALMVTEYGTTEASGNGVVDEAETKLWWNFMDDHHISYCNWSIADKNESSAALKPGASATGNWSEEMINASGLLVRKNLREKYPFNK